AASYAAAGDKKAAAMAIACVAAAAVPGAVAAIKVAKAAKEVKNLRTVAALGMMQKLDNAGQSRIITGYSRHALGRTAGTRNGQQISPQAIHYIVKNGKQTYNATHNSWNYSVKKLGSVSLNKKGRVTTVISQSRFARYLR
ncbi:hypothetical protein JNM87_06705, partial [Candidatus Saccharibacteria bacterium]|nr:hypothetical protein [Candidatus Saccharibacteria bacterium]